MKKIIFLLPIFLLLFSACKSDDDATTKGTSFIKATINGVEKTFNTVNAISNSHDSEEYYEVIASINNSPNETLRFIIWPNNPGSTETFKSSLQYVKNNNTYYGTSSSVNVVLINTQNRAYTGNFTGTVEDRNDTSVRITNASFEVYY